MRWVYDLGPSCQRLGHRKVFSHSMTAHRTTSSPTICRPLVALLQVDRSCIGKSASSVPSLFNSRTRNDNDNSLPNLAYNTFFNFSIPSSHSVFSFSSASASVRSFARDCCNSTSTSLAGKRRKDESSLYLRGKQKRESVVSVLSKHRIHARLDHLPQADKTRRECPHASPAVHAKGTRT